MSVASPQNRSEFKKYILTRLGDPVLQVNVADEQLDVCINDAFQYLNEQSQDPCIQDYNILQKQLKLLQYDYHK